MEDFVFVVALKKLSSSLKVILHIKADGLKLPFVCRLFINGLMIFLKNFLYFRFQLDEIFGSFLAHCAKAIDIVKVSNFIQIRKLFVHFVLRD